MVAPFLPVDMETIKRVTPAAVLQLPDQRILHPLQELHQAGRIRAAEASLPGNLLIWFRLGGAGASGAGLDPSMAAGYGWSLTASLEETEPVPSDQNQASGRYGPNQSELLPTAAPPAGTSSTPTPP